MEKVPTASELQDGKKAMRDAQRTSSRTWNAYTRLLRERRLADPKSQPSDAEVRAEQAYRIAAAASSEARERYKLLQSAAGAAPSGAVLLSKMRTTEKDLWQLNAVQAGIRLFEKALPEGWVYPCTLEDLREQLLRLPLDDLRGLHAIGLAASTRRDHAANGRYCFGPAPVIRLYSFPTDLRYKLPARTRSSEIECGLAVEQVYGLQVERVGSRYYLHWETSDLRRFILEHVLPHEVGHHVYHTRRREAGYVFRPGTAESEQFAEAYARRMRPETGRARG